MVVVVVGVRVVRGVEGFLVVFLGLGLGLGLEVLRLKRLSFLRRVCIIGVFDFASIIANLTS